MSRLYSKKCSDCAHRLIDTTGKVIDCRVKLFGNLNCRGYSIDKGLYDIPPTLTLDEVKMRVRLMYDTAESDLLKSKISTIISLLNRVVL